MELTKKEAEGKYPGILFIGEKFYIEQGAYIGRDAHIEQGARIGRDAHIGQGARITVVVSRYFCNIIPMSGKVLIRIGCQIHDIDTWESNQWHIAAPYVNEDDNWYETYGQYIYQYLKGEAERYAKE